MKSRRNRFGMVGMSGIFSSLAVLASLLFESLYFTLGVAAGGALMTGDVFLLRRVITGLLGSEPQTEREAKSRRRKLLFQYVIKEVGLVVILAALIWKTKINPAGLLVGVTAAIIGPIYVGLRDADLEE